MSMIPESIASFINKISNRKNEISDYVYFKIVSSDCYSTYKLRCVNSNNIFRLDLLDIVFDTEILFGLHPSQACFIGIEYATYIKKIDSVNSIINNINFTLMHRYGVYSLQYQTRDNDICFIDLESNKIHIMDPRDLSLSKNIIEKFDSSEAFYIGISAGFKMKRIPKNYEVGRHLKIVK